MSNVLYSTFERTEKSEILICEDLFSLFLVEEGSGSCLVDDSLKEVKRRQIYFVFPQQKTLWNLKENSVIHQILIPEDMFKTFGSYLKYPFSHYKKLGVLDLSTESFERFIYEFTNIKTELNNELETQLMVEFRLKVILLSLSKEVYRLHFEKRMDSACLVSRFITLVFENCRADRSVKFYADKLEVTTNYLNVICNKYLNKTASGIINNELLAEIKQYLIISTIPIKEISMMMNFNTLTNFYAYFKRHMGMTPKEFQKKYGNANVLYIVSEDL